MLCAYRRYWTASLMHARTAAEADAALAHTALLLARGAATVETVLPD